MALRLFGLVRHLPRPRLGPGHISVAFASATSAFRSDRLALGIMASAADQRNARTIHTAACLVIGDEVLGGKTNPRTSQTNSAYMAKWCFSLGINLRKVEVIEDDEDEIIEAVRRMSERYDFVVTSGGIGPTHDDITYQSIAKAFGLKLLLHDEAYERMKKLSKPHKSQPNFSWDVESPVKTARLRMVQLPIDESRDLAKQALFARDDLWVPISVVNGNVHILPGVPRLFETLLESLRPHIIGRLADPEGRGICRVIISTPMVESAIAGYLTELAAKVAPRGVKVGSYPQWGKKYNTVTLVGRDSEYLESLVPEVILNVQGRRVHREGEGETEAET
ncbi:molybdenum cofactor synthesis domain-containing protein [Durotheca rogersii]|uniref:molybdenum cofactor synthesis domain-containing protein n=1 Tax=Durotheca rogersii TaxID=419775 RepID=UPI00221F9399|nr:molybdenum cofactor synthesis domain-containing protein [Durotheca rogersii]KAI5868383.1 molybdenum cofactor synthesis domain-containing protein [Durotheca rogersii]